MWFYKNRSLNMIEILNKIFKYNTSKICKKSYICHYHINTGNSYMVKKYQINVPKVYTLYGRSCPSKLYTHQFNKQLHFFFSVLSVWKEPTLAPNLDSTRPSRSPAYILCSATLYNTIYNPSDRIKIRAIKI